MSESHDVCGPAQTGNQTVAVVFDMDGVLVDSADPHLRSWQRLAEENGSSVTSEQVARTFGQQNRDIIPILFGPVSDEQLYHFGLRKEEIFRDLVRDCPPVIPGAGELVRELHALGVRLAIGSSAPTANIELMLEHMGVRECFSTIVSGDDVTRGKPDPQVFRMAMERLEVAPARSVVVEDAPVGVRAAKAAGASALAVLLHHPAEAFPDADLCVERLSDVSAHRLMALAGR